jgi:hypothetical protein
MFSLSRSVLLVAAVSLVAGKGIYRARPEP